MHRPSSQAVGTKSRTMEPSSLAIACNSAQEQPFAGLITRPAYSLVDSLVERPLSNATAHGAWHGLPG